MANVWTRLLHGCAEFLEARGNALLSTSFASPQALLDSLINGAQPDEKPSLQALRNALGDGSGLSGDNKTLWDAINTDIGKQHTAITAITVKLAVADFGLGEAKAVGQSVGDFVSAGTDAIGKVAAKAAAGDHNVESKINSNMEPWADGLRDLAGNVPGNFDQLCSTVLGIQNASLGLWHMLELDLSAGRLNVHLVAVGQHAVGPVSFDGAEIEAFVQFKPPVMVGIALVSKIKAGLRGDATMKKIIPGETTADTTDAVAFQLDTDKGFSLGSGKTQRVVLPVRFTLPIIEMREFAVSSPNAGTKDAPAQIDFTTVLAGKFGSVLSFVCEGGGVSLVSNDGHSYDVEPKAPDGLGLRISAGPVVGGGYVRHDPVKNEYGGALQLTIAKVGVTAVGLLQPDTMALLVVLGVHFPSPGIQLGFGFSLDAVGGLVASDRRLDMDQLSSALKDGAVSNILLPDDPVSTAPTILNQLSNIFPPQAGAFVVGPIIELGWGGESGLVTARVGVLIALPDPSVTILGSLQVLVPPKIVEKAPRVVELNIDLFAAIEPDEFFLKATLRNSKIAGLAISGDLALLIRWASDSAFDFSAGGFFPTYKYPPKLAGLQRLAVKLAPPVKWLSLKVTGYVAVTSNSVQFGGAVDLSASVGPASGEAHLSLDAMFVFSPRFAFIVEFNASVAIKAFGQSICGAAFRGTVSGTAPWHVEGSASVSILWWDVDFPVGPIEWGDRDTSVLPLIDSMAEVLKALDDTKAWSALPPSVSDAVTILRPSASDSSEDVGAADLLQPFSLIEAKQQIAPFDVDITRLGAYASTIKQFNFANPKINGAAAPSFSEVKAPFAMGQFKEMTQDEKASKPDFEDQPAGIRISPTAGTALGRIADATLEWDTFFPKDNEQPVRGEIWKLAADFNRMIIAAGAVAKQRRKAGNPYAPPAPGPIDMADPGIKNVVPIATAQAAAGAAMTTTEADIAAADALRRGEEMQVVSLGLAA
jgi:hypothetical protein